MSETKKSILAETLEDIQIAKQQVEENANFILSTTLKDELNEIINKGLTESANPEDIATDDTVVDSTPTDDAPATDDTATLTDPTADATGDEEVVDLTGATPEEVISSFKLMAPADEIEIVRSEDGIQINFNQEGSEENPADAPADASAVPADLEEGKEETEEPLVDENESGEPVFEIEITDDEETVNEEPLPADLPANTEDPTQQPGYIHEEQPVDEAMSHHVGMKDRNIAHNGNDPLRVDETEEESTEETVTEDEKVEDVQESQNKLVAARKKNTALVLENKRLQKQIATTTADVKTFKDAEKQYKEAITALKNQLQEVALYTSNLTYAVKLMTENATTKDEKSNILKRLDGAKTISESKEVYTTLSESFKGVKTAKAKQIVESKLNDDKASGSSKLNETSVYSDPQVDRIKEIIQKMKY